MPDHEQSQSRESSRVDGPIDAEEEAFSTSQWNQTSISDVQGSTAVSDILPEDAKTTAGSGLLRKVEVSSMPASRLAALKERAKAVAAERATEEDMFRQSVDDEATDVLSTGAERSELEDIPSREEQLDLDSTSAEPKSVPAAARGAKPQKKNKKERSPTTRTLRADTSHFKSLTIADQPKVPQLAHSLDRVLFNPGVYHLQDPRSRVFNFDPYVEKILPVSDFNFAALQSFVSSSKDKRLEQLARQHNKRYVSSSSSMTGVLATFHFLLSQWRPLNLGNVSRSFPEDSLKFTRTTRGPAAAYLRWRDGTYALEVDKTYDTETVLSALGHSMEKFLTRSPEEFHKFRKPSKSAKRAAAADGQPEPLDVESNVYHYSEVGDFLVRSQLDAGDARLPGTGIFDLKTRAVVAVRMDSKNYEAMRGYEIRGRFGRWESFEREYYDMVRSVFLKYSLQARLGRMDGIFVAFHNTTRFFGFQYIPLEEMDQALHGVTDPALGDNEMVLSMQILNDVLDRATRKFPKQVRAKRKR